MTKPIALFDIDKTMFDGLSYFPLLEAQTQEGLLSPTVKDLADQAMGRYRDKKIEYEDFVSELLDIYASGLEDKEEVAIQESTDNFFANTSGFFSYVSPTIELLRPTHEIVLITGSPQFTARAVAKVFLLDATISTELGVEDGVMNGRVSKYLSTRHEKRDSVAHLTEVHPFEGSFGFGDSEGDIEILASVENAVCIRPTDNLRQLASERSWSIVDSEHDLSSNSALAVVRQRINS